MKNLINNLKWCSYSILASFVLMFIGNFMPSSTGFWKDFITDFGFFLGFIYSLILIFRIFLPLKNSNKK